MLVATGCLHYTPQQALTRLRSIRDYLGTTDPPTLGAALLLEQVGCVRGHEQLRLDLSEGPS